MVNFNKLKLRADQIKNAAVVAEEEPSSAPVKVFRKNIGQISKERAEHNFNSEICRIMEMPIEVGITEAEYDMVNAYCVKPEFLNKSVENGGFRLFQVQAEAVLRYAKYDGAFLPITVGGGKTLTSLLIANEAFFTDRADRIMLIIPPNLVDQLRDVDLPFYRERCHINVQVHFIAGMAASQRLARSKSKMRGLYVFTYSLLSSPNGAELLENIAPQLIIADEAHNLSSLKKSARAQRYNSYIKENKPNEVALSGTITRCSPMEYFDTARNCLREYNFLPNIQVTAEAWAQAIGSSAEDENSGSTISATSKPLLPLIQWAREKFPEEQFDISLTGFRKAFRQRLVTCPGVVSSGEDHLDVKLTICNDDCHSKENETGWAELQEHIERVKNEWVTPTGDEIEFGMHLWKWLYELEGAGFYNELYWPDLDWICRHRNVTEREAQTLLSKSQEYHGAHQEYARELRKFISDNATPGLDTPMLIGLNMSNHGNRDVGTLLYDTWMDMKNLHFPEIIERLNRSVRVCPFKINNVVRRVKQLPPGEGCIIWYYSAEIGRWLVERLRQEGLDPLYCPAGDKYNAEVIKPEHRNRPVVASISAHGTGKNLQHFGYEIYAQWPRDAKLAEQSLGRIHRNGQKRDEVFIFTNNCGMFDFATFAATLNDAAYIHQTLGNNQRLMTAAFLPKPVIVPYQALHEWGLLDVKRDKESDKLLRSKFA